MDDIYHVYLPHPINTNSFFKKKNISHCFVKVKTLWLIHQSENGPPLHSLSGLQKDRTQEPIWKLDENTFANDPPHSSDVAVRSVHMLQKFSTLQHDLVGGFSPSEKHDLVRGGYSSQHMERIKTCSTPPTSDLPSGCLTWLLKITIFNR